jgi:hypothetical protein
MHPYLGPKISIEREQNFPFTFHFSDSSNVYLESKCLFPYMGQFKQFIWNFKKRGMSNIGEKKKSLLTPKGPLVPTGDKPVLGSVV